MLGAGKGGDGTLVISIRSYLIALQALEREETDLYEAKEETLRQSRRLSASFLEQKGELEGSMRRAEESARIAGGKVSALQRDVNAARYFRIV